MKDIKKKLQKIHDEYLNGEKVEEEYLKIYQECENEHFLQETIIDCYLYKLSQI